MSFSNIRAEAKTIYIQKLLKFSLIGLTCCVLLNACGGKEDAPKEEVAAEAAEPVSTKATTNDIALEVQKNREKWQAHEISGYQIEMQKICYCVPEVVRMMVFEVEGDDVTSVRYADTGEDVDPQHYGDFNTVEGMFTFVEQAIAKNPADLSIAYDENYGYIKELSVDFKENIADDEISIIASNMRPTQ